MDPLKTSLVTRILQFPREASIPEITSGLKKWVGCLIATDSAPPRRWSNRGQCAVARRFLERCRNRWKLGHAKNHRFHHRHCIGGQCPKDRDGEVGPAQSDSG